MRNLLPLLACLFMVCCDESLPPREEIRDFLKAGIRSLPGPVTVIDSIPQGTDGGFYVELRNVFDEVLQDSAFIRADIDIWLKDAPNQRGNAVCDAGNLVNGNIISGGLTTLNVDSAAKFIKQWNHRTNEGRPFWSLVPLHQRFTPGGVPYCESDTLRFVAQASVQVFKHVRPEQTAELRFDLVYWVFGIRCDQ